MDPTVTDIPMGVGEQPQGRTVKEGGWGSLLILRSGFDIAICMK